MARKQNAAVLASSEYNLTTTKGCRRRRAQKLGRQSNAGDFQLDSDHVLNVGQTATEQRLKITEFEVASVQGDYRKNVQFMQINALRLRIRENLKPQK